MLISPREVFLIFSNPFPTSGTCKPPPDPPHRAECWLLGSCSQPQHPKIAANLLPEHYWKCSPGLLR